jgi:uncharacterized metal-binding protein
MANALALRLDRAGLAEMSCIAGVGGGVEGLVRTAQTGRAIVALDGCVLHCTRACLAQVGVEPTLHLTLSEFGVRKRKHTDFCTDEASRVYAEQLVPALRVLAANDGR